MELSRRKLFAAYCAGWLAVVIPGLWWLWGYEGAAGASANPALIWPAQTALARSSNLPTLVMFVHPQCPCSRATMDELAKLMTRCQGKLAATVVFLHPANMPVDWEKTDLWSSAASIPSVAVFTDENGTESHRFAVATSGNVLLYSADGRLLFNGGITESRGHSGDNAGRSAVELLALGLADAGTAPASTPVYGCGLFNSPGEVSSTGSTTCHN